MSIIVVQLAPAGLLFGADRNVTSQLRLSDGSVVAGQSECPKVLKRPNHEVIAGYVGQVQLARQPADEWPYCFIGQHLHFNSLHEVAHALRPRG